MERVEVITSTGKQFIYPNMSIAMALIHKVNAHYGQVLSIKPLGQKIEGAGACPDCGGPIAVEEGCRKCHSCGYSACG
jgi:hypothetical protein